MKLIFDLEDKHSDQEIFAALFLIFYWLPKNRKKQFSEDINTLIKTYFEAYLDE